MFDGTNLVAITDEPTSELCAETVIRARGCGALRAEIRVPMERLASRSELEVNGYAYAGTIQSNEGGRCVTRARFVFSLRVNELAVPTPQIAPSAFEAEAIRLMQERYGKPEAA